MKADELKDLVVKALDDMKAIDLVALNVHEKTSVTDWMVIASGTSNRHVKSLAENAIMSAKKAGVAALGIEGELSGDWVLADLGDVVVHVMLPDTRLFYNLEKLWSVDGPGADIQPNKRMGGENL